MKKLFLSIAAALSALFFPFNGAASEPVVKTGLEVLRDSGFKGLSGRRVGLVHLAGYETPLLLCFVKEHGVKSGRTENNIKIQLGKIILAKLEFYSKEGEFSKNISKSLCRAFVAGGYIAALSCQKADKGKVAYAYANNSNGFIFKSVNIFIKCQIVHLFNSLIITQHLYKNNLFIDFTPSL